MSDLFSVKKGEIPISRKGGCLNLSKWFCVYYWEKNTFLINKLFEIRNSLVWYSMSYFFFHSPIYTSLFENSVLPPWHVVMQKQILRNFTQTEHLLKQIPL